MSEERENCVLTTLDTTLVRLLYNIVSSSSAPRTLKRPIDAFFPFIKTQHTHVRITARSRRVRRTIRERRASSWSVNRVYTLSTDFAYAIFEISRVYGCQDAPPSPRRRRKASPRPITRPHVRHKSFLSFAWTNGFCKFVQKIITSTTIISDSKVR